MKIVALCAVFAFTNAGFLGEQAFYALPVAPQAYPELGRSASQPLPPPATRTNDAIVTDAAPLPAGEPQPQPQPQLAPQNPQQGQGGRIIPVDTGSSLSVHTLPAITLRVQPRVAVQSSPIVTVSTDGSGDSSNSPTIYNPPNARQAPQGPPQPPAAPAPQTPVGTLPQQYGRRQLTPAQPNVQDNSYTNQFTPLFRGSLNFPSLQAFPRAQERSSFNLPLPQSLPLQQQTRLPLPRTLPGLDQVPQPALLSQPNLGSQYLRSSQPVLHSLPAGTSRLIPTQVNSLPLPSSFVPYTAAIKTVAPTSYSTTSFVTPLTSYSFGW